ncbi:MAG: ribokinase [Actinomycetota bacterium]
MTDRPLAVLGAINVDLVVAGAALPGPGATVVGGAFARHHGGKGGNQAVAAARAGARVAMLGAVGGDPFGDEALGALDAEGIGVAHVQRSDAPTGVALIVVDAEGENQIAVAPGANAAIGDLGENLDALDPSVVLVSCEVPIDAVRSAGSWCHTHDATFVLNPAPASPELREILDHAAVVTPNRVELAALVPDVTGTGSKARELVQTYRGLAVVVTMGADGALLVDDGGPTKVDAPLVDPAVDTTGAGDCFNGVVAAALWNGVELTGAVHRGVVAAAMSVSVAGAREGMPTKEQIDEFASAPQPTRVSRKSATSAPPDSAPGSFSGL